MLLENPINLLVTNNRQSKTWNSYKCNIKHDAISWLYHHSAHNYIPVQHTIPTHAGKFWFWIAVFGGQVILYSVTTVLGYIDRNVAQQLAAW